MYRPYYVELDFMDSMGYALVSDFEGYLKYENKAGVKCEGYGLMPCGLRSFTSIVITIHPRSRFL